MSSNKSKYEFQKDDQAANALNRSKQLLVERNEFSRESPHPCHFTKLDAILSRKQRKVDNVDECERNYEDQEEQDTIVGQVIPPKFGVPKEPNSNHEHEEYELPVIYGANLEDEIDKKDLQPNNTRSTLQDFFKSEDKDGCVNCNILNARLHTTKEENATLKHTLKELHIRYNIYKINLMNSFLTLEKQLELSNTS